MFVVSELNSGWNGPNPRRSRQRAAPKPFNPRKTIKPTPRGKYGLSPRREVLQETGDGEGPSESPFTKSSSSSTLTAQQDRCLQFYQKIVAHKVTEQHPVLERKLLFQQLQSVTPQVATPALLRKVVPAIVHTRYWPRLQCKLLPRFLFVLNDIAAVALLKTLVVLQPPPIPPAVHAAESGVETLSSVRVTAAGQQEDAAIHQTAFAAPSSITGAFRGRHQLSFSFKTAVFDPALDAAAVGRGFKDAHDEGHQFKLMLQAVYIVLQDKLALWHGWRLAKLLGYAAQLQLHQPPPQSFMQAWFDATQGGLQQQTGNNLVVCLEALACLHFQPPERWLEEWTVASRLRLQQLSLQQLAMLALHVAELQLQLPPDWWGEFCCAVLERASGKPDAAHGVAGNQQPVSQQAPEPLLYERSATSWQQVQQHQQQRMQQDPVSVDGPGKPSSELLSAQALQPLTRPAADAVCSILWSCGLVSGFAAQEAWLRQCLELALVALQRGHCSSGAAVQLLHAFTCGAYRQTPVTGNTQAACLVAVQHRLVTVCGSSALQLLLDCLEALSTQQLELCGPMLTVSPGLWQQTLPEGFCEDMEAALTPVLPALPNELLLKVAKTFKCLQYKPGVQLLSTFALMTSSRMTTFSSQDIVVLVECCHSWGVIMPTMWLSAVLQHVEQLCVQYGVRSEPSLRSPAPGSSVHMTRESLARVLNLLPGLAADWSACREQHAKVLALLQYTDTVPGNLRI